jgi:hypothetical protein
MLWTPLRESSNLKKNAEGVDAIIFGNSAQGPEYRETPWQQTFHIYLGH